MSGVDPRSRVYDAAISLLGFPNYFRAVGSEIPPEPGREARLLRITTLAAALMAAALLAGCGDDEEDAGSGAATTATTQETTSTNPETTATDSETTSTSPDTTSTTPAGGGPIAEIRAVRKLLDRAVTKYEAGDAKAAERLVGDAYLEHFEKVERPLEKRDAELMESLEKKISTTIRDRIKAGASIGEVAALVEETKRQLVGAEKLLR